MARAGQQEEASGAVDSGREGSSRRVASGAGRVRWRMASPPPPFGGRDAQRDSSNTYTIGKLL